MLFLAEGTQFVCLFFPQLIPDDMEFQSGDVPCYATSDGLVCHKSLRFSEVLYMPMLELCDAVVISQNRSGYRKIVK